MPIIKHLMQYKSVLDDAKPSFSLLSFLQPTVKGEFHGYIAEYGIRREERDIEIFFRILLKERVKISPLLWDRCPVKSSVGVDLCYGRWLTITESTYSNIKRTIDSLGEATVRNHFERLVDVAHKLESGDDALGESVSTQQKKLIKDILLVMPIGIAVFAIMYWLFVYAMR